MLWFSYISFYIPIKYIIGQDKQQICMGVESSTVSFHPSCTLKFDWLIMRGSFFHDTPPPHLGTKKIRKSKKTWNGIMKAIIAKENSIIQKQTSAGKKLDISTFFTFSRCIFAISKLLLFYQTKTYLLSIVFLAGVMNYCSRY